MSVLKTKDGGGNWTSVPSIKGDTGDAAGFGTVVASVDANHGTPSVTVTTSGDDTAKNFDFAFHNLQPAPYDDSELQQDFATLQGQFDTAVAALTVDSEVADIRIGADGTTYQSAGAAVRGQVSDLRSDIAYDGIRYFPKANINSDPYNLNANTGTGVEVVQDDGCNMIHITNAGTSRTWYLNADHSWSVGETLYFRMDLKGSANDLSIRLRGNQSGTNYTLHDFSSKSNWQTEYAQISLNNAIESLNMVLRTQGEVWIKNVVVSASPIPYDYSVKTKLDKIEPLVELLNGNITIDQFESTLKAVFSYKYTPVSLTFSTGFIKTDGTLDSNAACHYASQSVLAGERYKITSRHGSSLRMYVLVDSNSSVVDYYPSGSVSTVTDTKEITIPTNGTLYVNTYDTTATALIKATGLVAKESGEGIADKTWYALGDSITAYATGYHSIIANEVGVDVTNGGVSGCGYMKPINAKTFVDRSELTDVYDIVTVFGSVNDMQYVGDYLGTESDSGTATLGGCFNSVIDNLYASGNYHIGIISPIPQGTTDGNPNNTTGTFAKYVDLLEKVCKRRGVPYLDLWHCSNMQPWDADFADVYMQDNTHPNTDGHAIFAPRIKAFIESL